MRRASSSLSSHAAFVFTILSLNQLKSKAIPDPDIAAGKPTAMCPRRKMELFISSKVASSMAEAVSRFFDKRWTCMAFVPAYSYAELSSSRNSGNTMLSASRITTRS